MNNSLFQEIDALHSEWSTVDNATKIVWLAGQRIRINGLLNQFAQYVKFNGGFLNDTERAYANKLLEMSREINSEGSKVANDLTRDAFRELCRSLLGF